MSIPSSGLFDDRKLYDGCHDLRTSFNRHLGILSCRSVSPPSFLPHLQNIVLDLFLLV